MHTLIIHHTGSSPDRFELQRASDSKRIQSVEIPSPDSFPVQGRPDSNLSKELRWYLEEFLDYPFDPYIDLADRVLKSLQNWGETAFNALFGSREGGKMLDDAIKNGYENLHLQISSDDPRILAWHWEALKDPNTDIPFAHECQIERKLMHKTIERVSISKNLPQDCVNILLVTARPLENDVRYRSVSRLLVELIDKQNLPANVHILRPPTFDNLRETLKNNPNFYHILHFDGHGYYGPMPADSNAGSDSNSGGSRGCLFFEFYRGGGNPVLPEELGDLLREYSVPAVVLNACQSGMIDKTADDPYASVAAALLKSGVRSVLAMAYSLYISAAQVFLPEFYRSLFENGSMETAVRAGRQQMLANSHRLCIRGQFKLQDWLVPVLYQENPLDFSFATFAKPAKQKTISLPPEIEEQDNYEFIGRDSAILELERTLRLEQKPAILIQGLGGVGKTTLAKAFIQWLRQTEGLENGVFWFAFNEIHNAESVLNRMGEKVFDEKFCLEPLDDRLEALCAKFREHPWLIIWDNFESVCGIPGTEVSPFLDREQQKLLEQFLQKLAGGKTKIIITSRSEEKWLAQEYTKLSISGLDREERRLYFDQIVKNKDLHIQRDDPDLPELIDELNGHPLCMQVVIPLLEKQNAKSLKEGLINGMGKFQAEAECADSESNYELQIANYERKDDHAEAAQKLYATLELAVKAVPEELKPLLILLGLHERFVHLKFFEDMAEWVDKNWTFSKINQFADILCHMGLLTKKEEKIFELHPVLTGFLRSGIRADTNPMLIKKQNELKLSKLWMCTTAFVLVLGSLADKFSLKELHEKSQAKDIVARGRPDKFSPKKLYEKRALFHIFGASFYFAMNEAKRMGDEMFRTVFLQSLALYAKQMRNYKEAEDLYLRFAKAERISGTEYEAIAYHQLGMIAQEKRDFDSAEVWYKKSLEIKEKYGNDHEAATTYHQLGMIAEMRRDFDSAETWYKKSLGIEEKLGNERGAATTYHQLGMIAQEKRDFDLAECWYNKSLEIEEKYGNEHGVAITYWNLGNIALKKKELEVAEELLNEAKSIFENLFDEHNAAGVYHQLGKLAEKKRDWDSAESWYKKSLEIREKQGDDYGAAQTYHQLGRIAEEKEDFDSAESWYRKSLKINEKQGDAHEAAITYHQLGRIVQEKRDWDSAENCYKKSMKIKEKQGDAHGAAQTYGQMGILAGLQGHFEESGKWLIKAILVFKKCNAPADVEQGENIFQITYNYADLTTQTKLKTMWEEAGLLRVAWMENN
jgi:tetratricopeptide (TPR) repeat protein